MKIRNKKTGEIREISENELVQYGLGGKLNKLGVKNSLWNNIRANKGSGKKPTPEMLEQERKIKKMEAGGTLSGRDDLTAYKGRLHRNGGIMVSAKGTPTKSNPAAEVEHNETRFSKGDTVYIFSDKLRI